MTEAADKLAKLSLNDDICLPAPLKATDLKHGYVQTAANVKLHYVEMGSGPVVILLHGFPESWYGYRHQIHPISSAGYRVICPDQRGYGDSSAPDDIEEYSQEKLTNDIIALMDELKISKATVVGHDWGGMIAWDLALFHPDRLTGVCSVNTPFMPADPNTDPLAALKAAPGVFDYVLYFQEPGVAEKEMSEDMTRCFTQMFQDYQAENTFFHFSSTTRERGGIYRGLTDLPRSKMVSDEEIQYYVRQFEKSGFRGPLNWYRNYPANWKWQSTKAGEKITVPTLMVTSSHDLILKHEYSLHMEMFIPNMKRIKIENCTHWTLTECPEQFNKGVIEWCNELHASK